MSKVMTMVIRTKHSNLNLKLHNDIMYSPVSIQNHSEMIASSNQQKEEEEDENQGNKNESYDIKMITDYWLNNLASNKSHRDTILELGTTLKI